MTYDPFVEMARHKKVYGWTISLWEEPNTCPSLFRHMSDFKENHHIATTRLWTAMMQASWLPYPFRRWLGWLPLHDRYGDVWSLCHYWSNFEIADLDFFRGKRYQELFAYLDAKGGFYDERVSSPPPPPPGLLIRHHRSSCHQPFPPPPPFFPASREYGWDADHGSFFFFDSGAMQLSIPWQSACCLSQSAFITLATSPTAMTASSSARPTPRAASLRARWPWVMRCTVTRRMAVWAVGVVVTRARRLIFLDTV